MWSTRNQYNEIVRFATNWTPSYVNQAIRCILYSILVSFLSLTGVFPGLILHHLGRQGSYREYGLLIIILSTLWTGKSVTFFCICAR